MVHHISRIDCPSSGITIFVFGDLQYGVQGFDEEAWEEFKQEFKRTPNAYGLGLGDYMDYSRPTQRARIKSSLAYDDSTHRQLDNMVIKAQDELLNKMQFLEGKLIGIHNGHHCWEFANGTNSDQRLASALKATYLGWMASSRIVLKRDGGTKLSYTMISMHGNSGGRRAGGSTLWMENNIVLGWIADHYIMGHSCKLITWVPSERRTIRRDGPPGIDVTLPRCLQVGGFHRGYTDGYESSYVERGGFLPQPINWGVIRLKFSQRKAAQAEKGICGENSYVINVEQVSRTPTHYESR